MESSAVQEEGRQPIMQLLHIYQVIVRLMLVSKVKIKHNSRFTVGCNINPVCTCVTAQVTCNLLYMCVYYCYISVLKASVAYASVVAVAGCRECSNV